MSRKNAIALAALFLAAGCASDHPDPHDCDVDPSARPLGRKILPFIAWVKSRPAATADEVSNRDAMLADDGVRFMDRRNAEVELTKGHAHDLVAGFGPHCAERSAEVERQLEVHGDRMREDAHCFWTRAWHALKLLE
jgi:hypothetical protein